MQSISLPTDPRDYQIAFLASFLSLGLLLRDWTLPWFFVPLTLGAAVLSQWLLDRLGHEPIAGDRWKSALITGLGICLLLRANSPLIMMGAAFLAIASKFFLQWRGKHLFNPANFGIVAVLILGQGWVSPGQWGTDLWLLLLFCGAAGTVLGKVGRWDTSVFFLVIYGGVSSMRNLWLGWTWDVWGHQMLSGSLLLFAFFMVTDPRSIPDSRPGRLIWSGAIALVALILQYSFYLKTAVFWSLFALCPLTPWLDLLFPANRFQWLSPQGTAGDPALAPL